MRSVSRSAFRQPPLRNWRCAVALQAIGTQTHVQTQTDYERVMDLRDKLIHGNNVLFLCVTAWWIASLWIDEPGDPSAAEAEAEPDESDATALEASEAAAETESHPKSAGADALN